MALPILRELGLHATFFVASGFLDGGRMWNDTVIEAVRDAHAELDLSASGSVGTRRLIGGSQAHDLTDPAAARVPGANGAAGAPLRLRRSRARRPRVI